MATTQEDMRAKDHPLNQIKHTLAVLSGKGGVGKSMVTALLATYLQRTGHYQVGVLDADVTGPSIPKLFGAEAFKPNASQDGLYPVKTHSGIQLMSINLLLEDPKAPVIWRGPILANTVKQFWSEVIWGQLDFLLIDMPPGTGDIPLTVFQSLPLDGIIIVTSPQDLVAMIVQKAIHMAQMMGIPILGLVENMSHAVCPHCQETFSIFGESKTETAARQAGLPYLGHIPMDPNLAALADQGEIERVHTAYLPEALAALQALAGPQQASASVERVAIAVKDGRVAPHFGHCDGFATARLAGDKILDETWIENPGHKPGFLPVFLHEQGIDVILAGGMGSSAIELFQEHGMQVLTGLEGTVASVLAAYRKGELAASAQPCAEDKG